jgi:hypothetical protein
MFSTATIWILIPLAGIAVGAFKHWLEFQRETRNSTSELDGVVGELTRELQAGRERERELVERLENLEALVTSRLWRAVQEDPMPGTATREPSPHAPPPPDPAREAELARARLRMRPDPGAPPPSEPDPREKARRMAQRLGVRV